MAIKRKKVTAKKVASAKDDPAAYIAYRKKRAREVYLGTRSRAASIIVEALSHVLFVHRSVKSPTVRGRLRKAAEARVLKHKRNYGNQFVPLVRAFFPELDKRLVSTYAGVLAFAELRKWKAKDLVTEFEAEIARRKKAANADEVGTLDGIARSGRAEAQLKLSRG